MRFLAHEEVVGHVGPLRGMAEHRTETLIVYGDRRLTGEDCLRYVHQFARVMRAAGVGPGTGIGMLSKNLPEAYLVQLAGQILGARYTPLHPLGALDDHVFVLEDAEIDFLFYDPQLFSGRVAELRSMGAVSGSFALGDDGDHADLIDLARSESDDPVAPADLRGDDIETLYYTGGTTGKPKGVMHTRFGLWYTQAIGAARVNTTRPSSWLVCTPISHAGGMALGPAMIRGEKVVLLDGFEPAEFLATIEREKITSTFLVPTIIYVLLDYLRDNDVTVGQTLDEVFYGASPMSPSRLEAAIEVFGPIFSQGYGQTELGVGILALDKEDHRLDRPDLLASAGRPTIGVVAKILREDGTEADAREVGELCIRGPMVMKGYWKNEELTEYAFRGGWLHTDDMGFCDEDGYITLVDRAKDMVISGGFNVYPSEVENALMEHPAVSRCAVIGVPDPKWGEAVKAYVVLEAEATVTDDELIAHVRSRKGSVNAPKSIEIVDELPYTAVGKLDRKALRNRHWQDAERKIN